MKREWRLTEDCLSGLGAPPPEKVAQGRIRSEVVSTEVSEEVVLAPVTYYVNPPLLLIFKMNMSF
jgi:hypothetical protein